MTGVPADALARFRERIRAASAHSEPGRADRLRRLLTGIALRRATKPADGPQREARQ